MKIPIFRLKLLGLLDSSPIPLDQSNLFLNDFRFLSRSLLTDRNSFFFKGIRSNVFQVFVFLFDSSLDPFSLFSFSFFFFFFFCLFLSQTFKGFLPRYKVRPFYPFFLFKLHTFMHFS